MSIEGDASNSRAPEERNVYSKACLTQILKPQWGDMCIKTHYTRRSGILPDPKPQRGDMCIEYQPPKSSKAPAGRHVYSIRLMYNKSRKPLLS